jgi:hypothetical protein
MTQIGVDGQAPSMAGFECDCCKPQLAHQELDQTVLQPEQLRRPVGAFAQTDDLGVADEVADD